jgi:hypothetical protein
MLEIDNPGGGDCAFYAFVIGLIYIIQNEYQAVGNSITFNQWQNLGLGEVNLEAILKIDLYRLSESPCTYSRALLTKLQKSLRLITANTWKEELLDKIARESRMDGNASIIEGSPIYGKFMELVEAHIKTLPSRRTLKEMGKFNELALSSNCIHLAQTTARLIQTQLQGKSFAETQVLENSLVKQAVLTDVLVQNEVNEHSAILAAIDLISMNGRWGTHSDLNEIATKFNVNLNIANRLNGAMIVELPTITLHNKSDVHWTTEVDLIAPNPKLVPRTSPKIRDKSGKRQRDDDTNFFNTKDFDDVMPQRKSSRFTLQQSGKSKNSQSGNYGVADKILFFSNKQIEEFDDINEEYKFYEPVSTRLRERVQKL